MFPTELLECGDLAIWESPLLRESYYYCQFPLIIKAKATKLVSVWVKLCSGPIWGCASSASSRNECFTKPNIGISEMMQTRVVRTHSNCSVSSAERIYQIFFPGKLETPISFSSYPPSLLSTLKHWHCHTMSCLGLFSDDDQIEIYQELGLYRVRI